MVKSSQNKRTVLKGGLLKKSIKFNGMWFPKISLGRCAFLYESLKLICAEFHCSDHFNLETFKKKVLKPRRVVQANKGYRVPLDIQCLHYLI
jgi:hypothetical protein